MARSSEGDAFAAFERVVAERGVAGRPYQVLLEVLGGGGAPFDEVVRRTALPRRAVEEALAALGPAVGDVDGSLRLRAETPLPVASEPARPEGLLARMEELVAEAPRPKHELDHVAATPETVVRRATALHRTYALRGRRILLVGDRDLTSLALAMVDPAAEIAVVDIDDDVLAHIDRQPEARGTIRGHFADLRLGLPRGLRSWADLAVTDPPYTPGGVGLFVRRALEGLADLGRGRVALAYGYGDQPALGLKVQDALHDLRLVYEAVLSAFNRYDGAQAIGSASDLYLLRATSATERHLAQPRTARGARVHLYTHGPHAIEGTPTPLAPTALATLHAVASGPPPPGERPATQSGAAAGGEAAGGEGARAKGGEVEAGQERLPVVLAVGEAWPDVWPGGDVGESSGGGGEDRGGGRQGAPRRATLEGCFFPTAPQGPPCTTDDGAVVVDLRHDGGGLLVRLLLALRAPRLAVLVRNQHPCVTTAAAQDALRTTLGAKYALRYRRSSPTPQLAIVEATLRPAAEADGAHLARRFLLDRPHGKLGNVAREALITSTRSARAARLTKNAARDAVAAALPAHDLRPCLLDLPRHAIDDVLDAVARAAAELTEG